MPSKLSIEAMPIVKVKGQDFQAKEDVLAVEEPLQIQLAYGPKQIRQQRNISITMRTPGNDFELAVGFLLTEGIIQSMDQLKNTGQPLQWDAIQEDNTVMVELSPDISFDLRNLERHFYTSSSCGVCGKSSIDAVRQNNFPEIPKGHPCVVTDVIHRLPIALSKQQTIFANTGGLHAAALFDAKGNLKMLREDVGRHNAVDKLIGAALQNDMLPLGDYLLMLSGRVSFELVQKALMAGIPIIVAVGAPSTLAIELAQEAGITVLGFVRNSSCNIYCGGERIMGMAKSW